MKNATQFHIRPARPEEAGLFYDQHGEEEKPLGTVGHVRMDFGRSGNEFWHTWWPRGPEELNSPAFKAELLEISFTGVGIAGGCPAEKDNAGCYFIGEMPALRKPEIITAAKEFCDCVFAWNAVVGGACGRSEGRTLPAYPEAVRVVYPRTQLTAENAAKSPASRCWGRTRSPLSGEIRGLKQKKTRGMTQSYRGVFIAEGYRKSFTTAGIP